MWPAFTFNLVAALLIAGWYLRAVRRLEHRMDERMRKFDEWADAEDAKSITALDDLKASLRERADKSIAELHEPYPFSTALHPGAVGESGMHSPAPREGLGDEPVEMSPPLPHTAD